MKLIRRKSVVLGATAGLALALLAPVAAEAAIVPNQYVRTCSNITKHCTPYKLMNAYSSNVPSTYTTRWCYC